MTTRTRQVVANGVPFHVIEQGAGPAVDAVWHGHEDAAQALVEAGARLDIRSDSGLTPRDLALLYGYDELAQRLAEAERMP